MKVPEVSGADVVARPVIFSRAKQKAREWTDDADKSVREHLVSSDHPTVHASSSYGAVDYQRDSVGKLVDIRYSGNLDAKEDHINVFSWVSFWWVEPLMRRGALGLLRNPEDLLQLPKSLKTSKIRDTFRSIRQTCVSKMKMASGRTVGRRRHEGKALRRRGLENGGEGKVNEGGGGSGREVDSENESWYDSLSQHDVEGLLEEESREVGPRDSDEVGGSGIMEEEKVESVFWSLNKAVGWHFYPLGILKLLADMLGFAGPLLLHALVAFMENRTVCLSLPIVMTCVGVTVGVACFCV